MRKLIKNFYQQLTLKSSKNTYIVPLPRSTKINNILFDWPSHQGPFRGAVDFAVDVGTDVLAAHHGTVIEIIDQHELHGPSAYFAPYLNYITIQHDNQEYSQYGHIAKGSITVKVGETVSQGQIIAKTGLNGWMEEPFLEHLHFFVFKVLPEDKFKVLRIKFDVKLAKK